jgi:NADH dehydrogenase
VEGFSGECRIWSFDSELDIRDLDRIDCAIHLAHDFNGVDGARKTYEGTLRNIRLLLNADVKRQIFFSSYSAGAHATSLYGRTKYEIEKKILLLKGVSVVRPGLVIGDGGIYGRIKKWAAILPIIPLPNGGIGEVPVIGIDRLCRETLLIALNAGDVSEHNIFERQLKSLRQIVVEAAAEKNRRPRILAIPAVIVSFCLRLAATLRVPLPITMDNVEGFLANQSAQHKSTLPS